MVQLRRGSDVALQAIAGGLQRAEQLRRRREQEQLRQAQLDLQQQQFKQQSLQNLSKLVQSGLTQTQLEKLGVDIPQGGIPQQPTIGDFLKGTNIDTSKVSENILKQPGTLENLREFFARQQIAGTVPTIEKKNIGVQIAEQKRRLAQAKADLKIAKTPKEIALAQGKVNEISEKIKNLQRTGQKIEKQTGKIITQTDILKETAKQKGKIREQKFSAFQERQDILNKKTEIENKTAELNRQIKEKKLNGLPTDEEQRKLNKLKVGNKQLDKQLKTNRLSIVKMKEKFVKTANKINEDILINKRKTSRIKLGELENKVKTVANINPKKLKAVRDLLETDREKVLRDEMTLDEYTQKLYDIALQTNAITQDVYDSLTTELNTTIERKRNKNNRLLSIIEANISSNPTVENFQNIMKNPKIRKYILENDLGQTVNDIANRIIFGGE